MSQTSLTKDEITAFMDIASVLATIHSELVVGEYDPFLIDGTDLLNGVREQVLEYRGPGHDILLDSLRMSTSYIRDRLVQLMAEQPDSDQIKLYHNRKENQS